ncbi:hypothetical protein D9M68_789940 [compost metagenome]
MPQAAGADGAVAGGFFRLGFGHQLGKAGDGRTLGGGQHHGRSADQGDVLQVLHGVEGHAGLERRVHRVAVEHHADGVAVESGLGHRSGADHARGAADVLHDHRLVELHAQGLGQDARDLIDRAARWKDRNHADRFGRGPFLCKGHRGRGRHHRGHQGAHHQIFQHACLRRLVMNPMVSMHTMASSDR